MDEFVSHHLLAAGMDFSMGVWWKEVVHKTADSGYNLHPSYYNCLSMLSTLVELDFKLSQCGITVPRSSAHSLSVSLVTNHFYISR